MKVGGSGGANTLTGLNFEDEVDLLRLIEDIPGYQLGKIPGSAGTSVYFEGSHVARCFRKHGFYKFLEESGINWRKIISRQLLPDDALLVLPKRMFIIEVKYQQVEGSVDEKLQTSDFKRRQYLKLLTPLGMEVDYVYVLNDWFEDPKYKDVKDYIESVGCHYKFRELPLSWLGLPVQGDQ